MLVGSWTRTPTSSISIVMMPHASSNSRESSLNTADELFRTWVGGQLCGRLTDQVDQLELADLDLVAVVEGRRARPDSG